VRISAVSGSDEDQSGADQDSGAEDADVDQGSNSAEASVTNGDAAVLDDAGTPSDGVLDAASAHEAGTGALVLRYDFSGVGSVVQDRIGAAHGEIVGGAQLDGSGGLTLDGSNDFVNMPNALVSKLTSVTVVAWLTWSGGACWQRVFDCGSNSNGEDNAGDATSALSLSTTSCPNSLVTGLFELNSNLRAANGPTLSVGTPTQLALVMDGARGMLSIYVNGMLGGDTAVPWRLSQLNDVNCWLGRSQWMQDKFLQGRLDELRIYASALSAAEIAILQARGPNLP
jgi:hypothetical protein